MTYKNPLHRRANIHRVRFDTRNQRRIEEFAMKSHRQEATFLHDAAVLIFDCLERHGGDLHDVAALLSGVLEKHGGGAGVVARAS